MIKAFAIPLLAAALELAQVSDSTTGVATPATAVGTLKASTTALEISDKKDKSNKGNGDDKKRSKSRSKSKGKSCRKDKCGKHVDGTCLNGNHWSLDLLGQIEGEEDIGVRLVLEAKGTCKVKYEIYSGHEHKSNAYFKESVVEGYPLWIENYILQKEHTQIDVYNAEQIDHSCAFERGDFDNVVKLYQGDGFVINDDSKITIDVKNFGEECEQLSVK